MGELKRDKLYERIFTPPEAQVDAVALIEKAEAVLDKNRKDGFTIPSVHLYPHQWSWDSAFIAIGYSHYNQQYAQQELERLFSGQWENGMVPHIVFNPEADEDAYFPGPKFWNTHCAPGAPAEPKTSGICQPPIHATALRLMLENCEDRQKSTEYAQKMYPKVKAWHEFLYRERDPDDEGLVYIRHPWASGMDNSPSWDKVLENMEIDEDELPDYERKDIGPDSIASEAERPSDFSYDRYVKLLAFAEERNYDEEQIRKDGCDFMVQSVLFNSILCRAGRDLAIVAEWLGEDPALFSHQSNMTATAVNKKLWSDEHSIYLDYDLADDQHLDGHSIAGFMPMFAHIPSPIRAEKMFDYLDTGSFCEIGSECLAVPSYDKRHSGFDNKKYWRGPIWINMNWMLYHGLKYYGHWKYDNLIRSTILYLIQVSGFHEYYNPKTGEGIGDDDFSWSAALFLDLINYKRHKGKEQEELEMELKKIEMNG